MPLYEYTCEEDGSTIDLLRSMSAADDPVEDPEGKGRTFVRQYSTFQVGDGPAAKKGSGFNPGANGGGHGGGGGCGCGGCSCGRH